MPGRVRYWLFDASKKQSRLALARGFVATRDCAFKFVGLEVGTDPPMGCGSTN